MAKQTSLFMLNISLLKQGIDILNEITDEQYVNKNKKYYKAGVGKHIRHVLDHYNSLLEGWNDKIDYDSRERNTAVETDRHEAIRKIEILIDRFNQFKKEKIPINTEVLVKSNAVNEESESPWSSSTVKRELQFLVSHTVHHYALVAFILRSQKVDVPKEFGIAPSTLKYRDNHKPIYGSDHKS